MLICFKKNVVQISKCLITKNSKERFVRIDPGQLNPCLHNRVDLTHFQPDEAGQPKSPSRLPGKTGLCRDLGWQPGYVSVNGPF